MEPSEISDVEMGPGMDLVISLLTFVVVVLAILALERKASTTGIETDDNPIIEIHNPKEVERLRYNMSQLTGTIRDLEEKLVVSQAERDASKEAANKGEQQLARQAIDLQGYVSRLNEMDVALSISNSKHEAALAEITRLQKLQDRKFGEIILKEAVDDHVNATELERLQAELNEALARLATSDSLIHKQARRISEFEKASAMLNTDNVQLSERLSKASAQMDENTALLKDAIAEKDEILDSANTQIRSLNQRIVDMQRILDATKKQLLRQERRIDVKLNDRDDLEIFQPGEAKLTSAGRNELYRLLSGLLEAVFENETNVIRVAGHASPERMWSGVRRGFDNNLQLSAERSLTIAYELAALGVPIRCIVVEAFGRGRSPTLKNLLPNIADLGAFDEVYTRYSPQHKQQLANSFPSERRVEILVTSERDGQCSPQLLRDGIISANQEALRRRTFQ